MALAPSTSSIHPIAPSLASLNRQDAKPSLAYEMRLVKPTQRSNDSIPLPDIDSGSPHSCLSDLLQMSTIAATHRHYFTTNLVSPTQKSDFGSPSPLISPFRVQKHDSADATCDQIPPRTPGRPSWKASEARAQLNHLDSPNINRPFLLKTGTIAPVAIVIGYFFSTRLLILHTSQQPYCGFDFIFIFDFAPTPPPPCLACPQRHPTIKRVGSQMAAPPFL
ncbi:hypothetical protein JAAARDRAFT_210334 [Jaapia argillacea MUCL 33604]|uniref:Uncharacterized protein n=1 Tax=Jaapia argillacea MUCL 33604 TaxID=933084 RepID=A0A067PDC8_9AGAM|nr:hypothetical protein JAAARDRAFT_210334 [Jaapia argillacea MUCL 33604]